jgi:DNA-binding beta-propeller fold protein YncE
MFILSWRKNILLYCLLVVGLALLLSSMGSSALYAQGDVVYLEEVRAIDTNDFGLLNPAGLAFSFSADTFFVLEAHSTTQAIIAAMAPYEALLASVNVDVNRIDPINLAFDNRANRLLLFDTASSELVAIRSGADGLLDPSPEAITRFQVGPLGLQAPQGLTFDPANGHLFILDSAALQIVRIEPGADGGFDSVTALSEGRVTRIDLTPTGLVDPRGLAFNPRNGHLYLLKPAGQSLHEFTTTGQRVAILQLPPSEFVNPHGLVFALSGDATDDPSKINLYIADTGLKEDNNTGRELGRIMELSLPTIIAVPGDAPTIQEGVEVAGDGDVVLVAPGEYHENILISGKTITLASQFYMSQDANFINQTIIDGDGETVIEVAPSVGPDTKIIGFTIQNGNDGISTEAKLHILNNHFTGNKDAIDYKHGGGICRNNLFENNKDDAVDLDGSVEAIIEDNIIRNNEDDGIEVRLHKYEGPTLNIIIRRNIITGNEEDGIQLIGYPDPTNRVFLIERNLIKDNAMVGLGLMDDKVTTEDFRGASLPERIYLFNNTFIGNDHSLTGGDNLIALNNIFAGSSTIALKNVDGNSIAAHNLFWGNSADHQDSNIDTATTILADPRLGEDDRLLSGSPAINAGTTSFAMDSELDFQPNDYCGTAPDLGAYESCWRFLPCILRQE